MRRRGPDISRFVVKVYLCLNQNINSHKAIKGAKGRSGVRGVGAKGAKGAKGANGANGAKGVSIFFGQM